MSLDSPFTKAGERERMVFVSKFGAEALGTLVTVVRQPGAYSAITVRFGALWHFHERSVSGGVGAPSGRPFTYARMSCEQIPDGSDFGHSCLHGPPPHAILVCIVKSHNEKPVLAMVEWMKVAYRHQPRQTAPPQGL